MLEHGTSMIKIAGINRLGRAGQHSCSLHAVVSKSCSISASIVIFLNVDHTPLGVPYLRTQHLNHLGWILFPAWTLTATGI